MAATPKKLSPRQQAAVEALLSHDTLAAACAACNVPERTMRLWRTQEHFRQALESVRLATWQHALARLARLANKAVSTLDTAMDAPTSLVDPRRAAVSARAAGLVLSHVRDAEVAGLSERVTALENAKGER